MVKISVIIVNYKVRDFLEQALLSIEGALEGIPSEVFVVDNGSGDGSVPMVRERFPFVSLMENEENVGFARANNQAIRQAKGEVLCLINPDTLVREDTFRVCLDYLDAHPDVAALGCKVLNPDGTLQLSCRRSIPTPWVAFTKISGLSALFPKNRTFGRYNLTFLDPDETVEVEALSGSFILVRRRAVEEVGLLDEAFFMYGEDLDWCYRIGKGGWKIVYLPETQIIHYKGQSTKEASFDQLLLFYEAMRLFVRKHFHKGWSFFPLWFLLLGIRIRGAFSFVSRLCRRIAIPVVDVVLLQAGLVLAIFIRFQNMGYLPDYRIVNVMYTLVWFACLYAMGAYEKGRLSFSRALAGVLSGLVLNTSMTFFLPQYAYSRQVVLMAGGFHALSLGGWRLVVRLLSRVRGVPFLGTLGRALLRRRTLIVGVDESGRDLYDRLMTREDGGYDIVGFLSHEGDGLGMMNGRAPVLGTLKDLKRVARVHRVQEVIFASEVVPHERMFTAMANAQEMTLDFRMAPKDPDALMAKASIDHLDDIPLIDLDYRILYGPYVFLKRAADVAVSMMLLPFVAVVCLGAALHPSCRFQRDAVADGVGGALNIIRLKKNGRLLTGGAARLLLLVEVLKGDMSLVGSEIVPFSRGAVSGYKPGLTSLVEAYSGKGLSEEEKRRLHQYYLMHYSPLLDVEILLRSLFRF